MKKNEFLVNFFNEKKRSFLRGFIALIILFIGITFFDSIFNKQDNYIAKVSIENIIYTDDDFSILLDDLKNDKNVKAILVDLNSPGGTIVGSQTIYNKLKSLGENVPIAVSMKEVAASGGYLISLAADRIFCYKGTITGSVGVILQTVNLNNLLEKIGLEPLIVKSGSMKSVPNPFEKVDEEKKEKIISLVDNMAEQFLNLVIQSRNLSKKEIDLISDGSVFTGAQAKEINLVDEIGDEQDAITWLKKKADLDDKTKVLEIKKPESFLNDINLNTSNILKKMSGILAIWLL
tara:strand:+ start:2745 stop:3617 length:873 start_codon:yes stop_codon:yes gene_type:complete